MMDKAIQYIGEIDYCYFCLQEIQKSLSIARSPLERMVDAATGFDAAQFDRAKKEGIYLIKHIIKRKKQIDRDYSGDEKALQEIINLKAS